MIFFYNLVARFLFLSEMIARPELNILHDRIRISEILAWDRIQESIMSVRVG